jgi:MFS family permease
MPQAKSRSLHALDMLNFCNAGIQTGLGPFIAIFYTAVRHWDPGKVGTLIACQSLAGVALQSFTGDFVDNSRHKVPLTAVAATLVAAGAAGIALFPSFGMQIFVQLVIGVAVTVIPAATAAFALGLVGPDQLSPRVARNESLTHFGNVVFAAAAGALGAFVALRDIFYAAAVFAAGMAVAVVFIRQDEVNDQAARAGGEGENEQPTGFRDLWKDRRILTFVVAVVFFNISNSATLPLVSEILAKEKQGKSSAWQIAAAVGVAEIVMVVIAAWSGRKADSWGRKPLFLTAFAFLALRNGLTVFSKKPAFLIGLQAFDGVAAAIYGVLLTLVVADLARGTGRFNFLQGSTQSAMGLGGFLSNMAFGWLAKAAGFNTSFLGLSAIAVVGGLWYQFRMPETAPGYDEKKPREQQPENVNT